MTEEQIIKTIQKKNKKEMKRDPEGGICGSFNDNDTGKTYYYYHSFTKEKVTLYKTFDEAFDAVNDDFGWFYNYIGIHLARVKMKIEDIITKIRETFQRMTKGYDDLAIFEIDTWFIKIFPKMIRELRDKPSVPIIKDLIPDFDPTAEENRYKKLPSKYYKAWNRVLTRMIECFEGYKDTRDFDLNPYDYKKQYKKFKKWTEEQCMKNDAYLKEGLDLFVKYFRYLNW